jgi:hypothetical protein
VLGQEVFVDMRSLTFSVMGILMVTAAVACGKPFTATSGTGGSSSSAGSAMSSSSGTSCTVGDLTSCTTPGQYCADTNPPSCLSCADVSRFTFGGVQELDFQMPDMTANPSYPRVGADGALYFTYTRMTGVSDLDLGHADADPMKAMKWMKGVAEIPLVDTLNGEEGELLLPDGNAIMDLVGMVDILKPILLFHRRDAVAIPPTAKIYASDGLVVEPLILPELALPNNTKSYNVAVAHKAATPRLWYASNYNNMTNDELVTYAPGKAVLSVVVTLDNGCWALAPFNPWVDSTGSLLLVSSPYPDETTAPACKTIAGAVSHLFYIDLKAAADPLMLAALPVFPGDKTDRITPSMSDDLCVLYYTERNGTDNKVFSAIRQ